MVSNLLGDDEIDVLVEPSGTYYGVYVQIIIIIDLCPTLSVSFQL
jgi:hypothetical protein